MNRRRLLLLAALAPVVTVAACGDDDAPDAAPSVAIADAWARTTPPGTTVGAIYFVAQSTTDDALVSASVDPAIAASVEIHQMAPAGDHDDDNAMMSMQQVDRVDLPADEELDVDEAGYHVMLVDLAEPLATGESFELALAFEHAPDQTVTIEVREFAPGDD